MITSQASKLPSNLGIRGVCILSLRLVYNFPFQLPGRGNQWPGWAVTRLPPPLSPSLGIVINPRWLLSPSLQMLSDHRLAITTLNDWNTRIIGGVTASQCYGNIEISRWGQWSRDWQLWVGCVDWWHVQCSGPGINIGCDQSRVTFWLQIMDFYTKDWWVYSCVRLAW